MIGGLPATDPVGGTLELAPPPQGDRKRVSGVAIATDEATWERAFKEIIKTPWARSNGIAVEPSE